MLLKWRKPNTGTSMIPVTAPEAILGFYDDQTEAEEHEVPSDSEHSCGATAARTEPFPTYAGLGCVMAVDCFFLLNMVESHLPAASDEKTIPAGQVSLSCVCFRCVSVSCVRSHTASSTSEPPLTLSLHPRDWTPHHERLLLVFTPNLSTCQSAEDRRGHTARPRPSDDLRGIYTHTHTHTHTHSDIITLCVQTALK